MSNSNLADHADSSFSSDGNARPNALAIQALGYAVAFVMTGFATVIAIGVDNSIAIPNVSLVFVIPVVIAGLSFGLGPSLFSAVSGALAYNYFLTDPRYSLLVADPSNIWAICLLFITGMIVSGVAFTSRRRATEAAELRKQADILGAFSRDVIAASDAKAKAAVTARALAALFHVPAVVIIASGDDILHVEKVGGLDLHDSELQAARSAITEDATVHGGIYPDAGSRFDFWSATTGPLNAVLGLAFDPDERPVTPDAHVDVVRRLLALTLASSRD